MPLLLAKPAQSQIRVSLVLAMPRSVSQIPGIRPHGEPDPAMRGLGAVWEQRVPAQLLATPLQAVQSSPLTALAVRVPRRQPSPGRVTRATLSGRSRTGRALRQPAPPQRPSRLRPPCLPRRPVLISGRLRGRATRLQDQIHGGRPGRAGPSCLSPARAASAPKTR
jgi:hypothetical protein